MKIHVKVMWGPSLELEVEPNQTLRDVRASIPTDCSAILYGDRVEEARWVYNAKELKELDRTLADCNVTEGSTMHLIGPTPHS